MRASYEPLRTSSRRLESPFSWGFLGILVLALELLLPTCSGDCNTPPYYTTMRPKSYTRGTVKPNHQIDYECNEGYKRIDPPKPMRTFCQDDGSWKPVLEEACMRSCQKLFEPFKTKVIYDNGTTTYGSQVHYDCDEGYYLVGTKIRKCESNGPYMSWSDFAPTCERIFCEAPEDILNGDYTNSNKDKFYYNETVIYTCNPSTETENYTLVGESTLVCTGLGKWNTRPPHCKVRYKLPDESRNRADDLDGGLIAVIVLTVLVGVAVVGTCV